MTAQAIRFRCHKCREVFTIGAQLSQGASNLLVETIVPCPDCGEDNQITVAENQVEMITVDRGKRHGESRGIDLPRGVLLGQVFEGRKPET